MRHVDEEKKLKTALIQRFLCTSDSFSRLALLGHLVSEQ